MRKTLFGMYKKLYAGFGPQQWWPAETPFEVIVGAILTQNTSWVNVEKAISNLKKNNALSPSRLRTMPHARLATLIRSAGYYNIKARRLKNFLQFFSVHFQQDVTVMAKVPQERLRRQLLAVNGIGPETADSILLYALGKPAFVVDAYTKRILGRHRLLREDATYEQAQNFFMKRLKIKVQLYNEYHALLVRTGKEYCLKKKPRCSMCPLRGF